MTEYWEYDRSSASFRQRRSIPWKRWPIPYPIIRFYPGRQKARHFFYTWGIYNSSRGILNKTELHYFSVFFDYVFIRVQKSVIYIYIYIKRHSPFYSQSIVQSRTLIEFSYPLANHKAAYLGYCSIAPGGLGTGYLKYQLNLLSISIYCYKKTTHVVLNQLCSSLWTSRF